MALAERRLMLLAERLFYITTNYGTNENMRRRLRLK